MQSWVLETEKYENLLNVVSFALVVLMEPVVIFVMI